MPPVNDEIAARIGLGTVTATPIGVSGTTTGATEDAFWGGSGNYPDVWYGFTAPASGATEIRNVVANYPVYVAVAELLADPPASVADISFTGIACGDGTGSPPASSDTLTPGATYVVYVSGWNAADEGDFAFDLVSPAAAAPPTIVSEAATPPLSSSADIATIHATINPNGQASDWRVQYGPTSGYGTNTPWVAFGGGTADVAVTVDIPVGSRLAVYHYRVEARNATGTTDAADGTYEAPDVRNDTVAAVTDTTATIDFEVNAGGSAATFWAESLSPAGHQSSHGTDGSGSSWDAVSSTITGLTPNTLYTYKVFAKNANAIAAGTTHSFRTLLPALFGGCVDSVDDFTGDDCTLPAGWLAFDGDGIRIESNAAGAFQYSPFVRSRTTAEILGSGTGYNGDIWVTLRAIDSIQEVGLVNSSGDGYAVRADVGAGEIQLIRIDSLVATVLDTAGGITWADGDMIGIRVERSITTFSGYRRPVAGAWSAALVTAVDATYDPVTYGMLGESTPGGPGAIDLADAFDLSSYGQTPAGTAAINPPFTCADGIDIYSWDNLSWAGPYYGGDANFASIVCPVWWLKITASSHGKGACDTHYAMGWDTSENVAAFGDDGTAYASPVYYANSTDEDAALDAIELIEGPPFTFDADFAHKEIDAIQSSIDSLQSAFAADGAYVQTNTDGGSKTSRALLMPVHPAVGLMDLFSVSFGQCVTVRRQQIVRYR